MNKELTPLEALEILKDANTIYCGCASNLFARYRYEIETIETALKDYEKKTKLAKEYADVNNVAKRLKALEIVKEHLQASCLTTIEKVVVDVVRMTFTHEEFDLLKEVLK